MSHILVLLNWIRPTTIEYDISERLGREPGFEVTVACYEDASLEETEAPVDTDAVSLEFLGARNRFDRTAIGRLRELLTAGRFDLLHTQTNFSGALGRALAPSELPIVDTEHADHRLHYSAAQNAVNATTLWRADRVVANSQATLDSFYPHERLLVPERKRRVIYNGVDIDAIDAARPESNPWETDRPRVTTVGRMIPTKNQRTLIAAFDDVRRSVPDAELMIVGDGPERAALERFVRARRLGDHVTFTGTVSRLDVYRILHASDLFALSSHSEGFCVALVEAMACGLAPVVSDIPVLHEVAGETAAFADSRSPESFAAAIRTLLRDPERRERRARDADERARTEFPLERSVEEYRALYDEVLAERG
ncbi:glycosyltransferase family 4 protein [Natronorarus salvus]|uniref:glycosyltransferase family 4 protein n=1 Tax=Natronorarus salvus TaxID=3117733 RepID=UPI002F26BC1B